MNKKIKEFFNRVLALEEINGNGICEPYLYRWRLFSVPGLMKCYLHHFVGDDWSRDLHDHPKRFVSFGLKGGYVEETPYGEKEYRAPWVRSFPAEHTHRLTLIVFVLKTVRAWGFWKDGEWVPWRDYVGKHGESRKNCPD